MFAAPRAIGDHGLARDNSCMGLRHRMTRTREKAYHGNKIVLEGKDEGSAVHAGEQGEGEPQQHPLDLLLPHLRCLPMLQAQLGRTADRHRMYLHSHCLVSPSSTHPRAYVLVPQGLTVSIAL